MYEDPLNEDEKYVLHHVSRWGSDGYPVVRIGSHHWTWGPIRSIQGPPVVFKTKRAAVLSFEKYLEMLRERYGNERKAAAQVIQ